nr:hypothetical protein CFP56_15813 [Quercus suber]
MKLNSMKVSNTIMSSLGSNCKLKRSPGCHDLRKLLDLYIEQEKNEGRSTSSGDDEYVNASSSSVIDNYQDGNASTFNFSKLSEALNDAKDNANASSSDANKDVTTTTTYLKLPEFSKLSEALVDTETQEALVGLKLFHVPVLRYKHYFRRHSTSW